MMKYYKVVVVFLVEAEDKHKAQQKAVRGKSLLYRVINNKRIVAKIAEAVHRMIRTQPEKGLV